MNANTARTNFFFELDTMLPPFAFAATDLLRKNMVLETVLFCLCG